MITARLEWPFNNAIPLNPNTYNTFGTHPRIMFQWLLPFDLPIILM